MARRMWFFRSAWPPDVVDHLVRERVQEHPVDREIAAGGVELGRAEDDRLGPPAVDVGAIAAKSRDLDFDARLRDGGPNPHDAERDPDGDRAERQDRHDLFGGRRGGDVVVRGRFAQDQVADAAARPERLVTGLLQPADDLQGKSRRPRRFTHSDRFLGAARSRRRSSLECRPAPASSPVADARSGITLIAMRVSP